jgi:hypothetical protein
MVITSTASAEVETQARSAARAHVEATAAQLGVAGDEAKAIEDQRTLMPAVKEAVTAGAGKSLLEHSRNPSVIADLSHYIKPRLTHAPLTQKAKPLQPPNGTGGPARPGKVEARAAAARHVRAHIAGCWGNAWTIQQWETWVGTIAWIYVRENGWCGEWYGMSWLGGATFADWEWGPYCLTGHGQDYSWDLYPYWVHMANWGSLGISYPWGCLGIRGEKVVIRIASNGYWDTYNDYGF